MRAGIIAYLPAPYLSAPTAIAVSLPLERACAWSRHLSRMLHADPRLRAELETSLAEPFTRTGMQAALGEPGSDSAQLKRALRRLRKRVWARVAARDLAGLADLTEVVATVTTLAEEALHTALATEHRLLAQVHGEPRGADGAAQSLAIVGMGKLGGAELNVSSDIDLIFVYPEDGDTAGPRVTSNHEFFTRLGQRLIAALDERTADGFVFRVDMRLRPQGDAGALVSSLGALEQYFITQARAWERYAWLKARVVAGDGAPAIAALVTPFVYRKYLDFAAIDELRRVHAQIREEAKRRDALNNIKIGPGGIREIEFVTQIFQLVRGGRERALQVIPTRAALAVLKERGLLPAAAADELSAAYTFLRNLEHRLQYLDDAQTQSLPAKSDDLALIALAMGFADEAAFRAELAEHRARVTAHFESVFVERRAVARAKDDEALFSPATSQEDAASRLATLRFSDPQGILRRINAMLGGAHFRSLPQQSQQRVEHLLPQLVQAAAATADPDTSAARLLDLLETIDRRGAYLALLTEHPLVLARIAKIVGASRWAADYLRRHPILLDELLDAENLLTPPDWPVLIDALRADLAHVAGDTERQMDLLRHFKQAQVFRLLAQDLEGLMTVERVSDQLTELADRLLALTLAQTWERIGGAPDDPPRLAVIAYGKLGGKELGYASDLDIIFVYQDEHPGVQDRYARLVQRVLTWLNTLTPAGVLYETDVRLRPDGESGLLVVPVDALRDYQLNHAWTWEHQALTRARHCAGDARAGEAFERIRLEVLTQRRDPAKLRQDVLAMREKMRASRKRTGELFDAKHGRGGIIDAEFIVQYLILAHAHRYRELTRNLGTITHLRMAADLGIAPKALAFAAADSYREYRRLQHLAGLAGEERTLVASEIAGPLARPVIELWNEVFRIAA